MYRPFLLVVHFISSCIFGSSKKSVYHLHFGLLTKISIKSLSNCGWSTWGGSLKKVIRGNFRMRSPWYFKRVNGVQDIYLGTTCDTKFLVSNPPSSSSTINLDRRRVQLILVVVSNVFYIFISTWGKISNLTNIFQMGKPPTSCLFNSLANVLHSSCLES